jgi:hypothetical protein
MVDLKATDLKLGWQLTVLTAVASTAAHGVSEGVDGAVMRQTTRRVGRSADALRLLWPPVSPW